MAVTSGHSLRGLCEEAICSICLDYFKDPVIVIKCGHNFCRACLTQYWAGFWAGEASCPQCREKVPRTLIPNRHLANLAEKLSYLEGEKAKEKRGACEKHQEPLKLFCQDDQALICVVCDRAKEHREHQVVPLEEAAQEYQGLIAGRLELLKKERAEITKYKEETEKESQALLKQTKVEMQEMKAEFRKLRQALEEQETLLLAQMADIEKEIARKRDEHLDRLSEELSSLGGLIQEMEQKRQQLPGELLQDVRRLLQSSERKKPFQNPEPFPPELKWKIWDICDRNASLASTEEQIRANVTLDPDTANLFLVLSEDRKSVRYGDRDQDLPNNPERFDLHPFVLGCERFTAGRHYWEVIVETEEQWAVGVARKSVRRKDYVELSTVEGIWAMGKWADDYSVNGHVLSLSGKLKRIRISLNFEGHRVAFYDADTGSHLYTFYGASFSGETLLPFFYVWGKACLSISP
uniref:RING-type E3 ubiquitin transferase n=1 Tax=Pogona vitticeps TaxID=103695 RepID=A0ABM5FHG1_9SAUR